MAAHRALVPGVLEHVRVFIMFSHVPEVLPAVPALLLFFGPCGPTWGWRCLRCGLHHATREAPIYGLRMSREGVGWLWLRVSHGCIRCGGHWVAGHIKWMGHLRDLLHLYLWVHHSRPLDWGMCARFIVRCRSPAACLGLSVSRPWHDSGSIAAALFVCTI